MYNQSRFLPAFAGLAFGMGVASPTLAEMNQFVCQLDPSKPAGLTVNYDTANGQFALVDFFGSPNLPAGVQVRNFSPNAANLSFVLEYYNGSTLAQRESYALDFAQMNAILNRETFATNGSNAGQVDLSGVCQPVNAAPAPQMAAAADTPAFTPVLPSFYNANLDEFLEPVTAAVAAADQNIAIGLPASGILEPSNTVCAKRNTNNDAFIDAMWCATTKLESDDVPYGGILGFISPKAEYGLQPAWCSMGAGQGESVELKFWMPRNPPAIRSLVIRSGTGIEGDAPDKHAKPSLMRVEAEGMTWTWELQDNVDFQAITFDNPIHNDWVRVVIEDVYPGTSWNNVCASDLFAVFDQ